MKSENINFHKTNNLMALVPDIHHVLQFLPAVEPIDSPNKWVNAYTHFFRREKRNINQKNSPILIKSTHFPLCFSSSIVY